MIKGRYRTSNSRSSIPVIRYSSWFLLCSFIFYLSLFSSFASPVNTGKTESKQVGIQNPGNQATESKTEIIPSNESDNNESDTDKDIEETDNKKEKKPSVAKTFKKGMGFIKRLMPQPKDPEIVKADKIIEDLKTRCNEWSAELEKVNNSIQEKQKLDTSTDTEALHNLADTIKADMEKLQNDITLLKSERNNLKAAINHNLDKLVVPEEIEPDEQKRKELQAKFKNTKYKNLSTAETFKIKEIEKRILEKFNKVAVPYKQKNDKQNKYAYSDETSVNLELRANVLYLAKVEKDRISKKLEPKLTENKQKFLDEEAESLVTQEIETAKKKHKSHHLKKATEEYNKELTAVINGAKIYDQKYGFITSIKNLKRIISDRPDTLDPKTFMYPNNVSNFNPRNASSTMYRTSDNEDMPAPEDLFYHGLNPDNGNASSTVHKKIGEKHIYANPSPVKPSKHSSRNSRSSTNNRETHRKKHQQAKGAHLDRREITNSAASKLNSSSSANGYVAPTDSFGTGAQQNLARTPRYNEALNETMQLASSPSGQESQAKSLKNQVTENGNHRLKKDKKKKLGGNAGAYIYTDQRGRPASEKIKSARKNKRSDVVSSDDESNNTSSDDRYSRSPTLPRTRTRQDDVNIPQYNKTSDENILFDPKQGRKQASSKYTKGRNNKSSDSGDNLDGTPNTLGHRIELPNSSPDQEYASSVQGLTRSVEQENKNFYNDVSPLERKKQDPAAEQSGTGESSPVFKVPQLPVTHNLPVSVTATQDKIVVPKNLNKEVSASNWSLGSISSGYDSSTSEIGSFDRNRLKNAYKTSTGEPTQEKGVNQHSTFSSDIAHNKLDSAVSENNVKSGRNKHSTKNLVAFYEQNSGEKKQHGQSKRDSVTSNQPFTSTGLSDSSSGAEKATKKTNTAGEKNQDIYNQEIDRPFSNTALISNTDISDASDNKEKTVTQITHNNLQKTIPPKNTFDTENEWDFSSDEESETADDSNDKGAFFNSLVKDLRALSIYVPGSTKPIGRLDMNNSKITPISNLIRTREEAKGKIPSTVQSSLQACGHDQERKEGKPHNIVDNPDPSVEHLKYFRGLVADSDSDDEDELDNQYGSGSPTTSAQEQVNNNDTKLPDTKLPSWTSSNQTQRDATYTDVKKEMNNSSGLMNFNTDDATAVIASSPARILIDAQHDNQGKRREGGDYLEEMKTSESEVGNPIGVDGVVGTPGGKVNLSDYTLIKRLQQGTLDKKQKIEVDCNSAKIKTNIYHITKGIKYLVQEQNEDKKEKGQNPRYKTPKQEIEKREKVKAFMLKLHNDTINLQISILPADVTRSLKSIDKVFSPEIIQATRPVRDLMEDLNNKSAIYDDVALTSVDANLPCLENIKFQAQMLKLIQTLESCKLEKDSTLKQSGGIMQDAYVTVLQDRLNKLAQDKTKPKINKATSVLNGIKNAGVNKHDTMTLLTSYIKALKDEETKIKIAIGNKKNLALLVEDLNKNVGHQLVNELKELDKSALKKTQAEIDPLKQKLKNLRDDVKKQLERIKSNPNLDKVKDLEMAFSDRKIKIEELITKDAVEVIESNIDKMVEDFIKSNRPTELKNQTNVLGVPTSNVTLIAPGIQAAGVPPLAPPPPPFLVTGAGLATAPDQTKTVELPGLALEIAHKNKQEKLAATISNMLQTPDNIKVENVVEQITLHDVNGLLSSHNELQEFYENQIKANSSKNEKIKELLNKPAVNSNIEVLIDQLLLEINEIETEKQEINGKIKKLNQARDAITQNFKKLLDSIKYENGNQVIDQVIMLLEQKIKDSKGSSKIESFEDFSKAIRTTRTGEIVPLTLTEELEKKQAGILDMDKLEKDKEKAEKAVELVQKFATVLYGNVTDEDEKQAILKEIKQTEQMAELPPELTDAYATLKEKVKQQMQRNAEEKSPNPVKSESTSVTIDPVTSTVLDLVNATVEGITQVIPFTQDALGSEMLKTTTAAVNTTDSDPFKDISSKRSIVLPFTKSKSAETRLAKVLELQRRAKKAYDAKIEERAATKVTLLQNKLDRIKTDKASLERQEKELQRLSEERKQKSLKKEVSAAPLTAQSHRITEAVKKLAELRADNVTRQNKIAEMKASFMERKKQYASERAQRKIERKERDLQALAKRKQRNDILTKRVKDQEKLENDRQVKVNYLKNIRKEVLEALRKKESIITNRDITLNTEANAAVLNIEDQATDSTNINLSLEAEETRFVPYQGVSELFAGDELVAATNPVPPAVVVPYQGVSELFVGDELVAATNPVPPAVLNHLATKFDSNQQLSLSPIGNNSQHNDGFAFIEPETESRITISNQSPLYSGIKKILLTKGGNHWTVTLPADIGGGSVTVKLNYDGSIAISGDRNTIDNVATVLAPLARVYENNQQPQKDNNQNLTNEIADPLEKAEHKINTEIFPMVQQPHETQYDKDLLLAKAKEVIRDGIKEAGSTMKELGHAMMLFDAESGTEASKLIMDAFNFPTLTQIAQAIRKNTALNTHVPDIIECSINKITTRLHSRINIITDKASLPGKAAGDEMPINQKTYGAWIVSLYDQGIKKGQKGLDHGYKKKLYGKIIGADTGLNDNMTMIGFALSFINNHVKYNNSYRDRTKTDSMIFSLYGKQELTESWFAQWIASYSSTKIDHQEEKVFSFGNKIAQANYISKSYGGEILFGYEAKLNQAVLTPFTGISYLKSRDEGYREIGLPFANRTVAANNKDSVDIIAGARLSRAINTDTGMVIPEIHGMFSKRIKGKAGKMVAKIDGMNESFTDITRTSNTMGNFGIGITTKSRSIEYGASYDLQLANRYIGHQASIKVKINF